MTNLGQSRSNPNLDNGRHQRGTWLGRVKEIASTWYGFVTCGISNANEAL